MAYQVLARKWRPQTFDDVLGQQAVTRTLKNALKSRRIAHAFVFAGPRGCGKTTTARVLAKALNCVNGPTPEPCGACHACVEIAEGRDMDVLEIDAATHTGVDNVREVIIEGLSIAPVRNRFKVFLIDEVHMLSSSSFNALLKSIEEPPPHVVFMMATTELQKIPDTVLSRSQVHEFRTIPAKVVAERLRHIATEEQIEIPDAGLMLLARAGEGSMRDSLSAFDQVRAFAGDNITVDDVVTVLGLVGRDLVLDMLEAVAAEDAPAAFTLVERAIERGYDLRLLCRELARATRDLLIVSVDRSRADDPDLAAEGERDRLKHLADLSSREDLLRAFDLLTRAEEELRISDQPRYNLEMALLRLMHLRKLVPLADLLRGAGGLGVAGGPGVRGADGSGVRGAAGGIGAAGAGARGAAGGLGAAGAEGSGVRGAAGGIGAAGAPGAQRSAAQPARNAVPVTTPSRPAAGLPRTAVANAAPATPGTPAAPRTPGALGAPAAPAPAAPAPAPAAPTTPFPPVTPDLKDAFLAQLKASKVFFYNTVVAQAYRVDVTPSRITFTFLPNQKVPRQQCEDMKSFLEDVAQKVAGTRIPVTIATADSGAAAAAPERPPSAVGSAPSASAPATASATTPDDLRQEALSDPSVQALLEIFPVEKTKIEEM